MNDPTISSLTDECTQQTLQLDFEKSRADQAEKQLAQIIQQLTEAHSRSVQIQKIRGTEAALEAYHVTVEEMALIPESDRRARIAVAAAASTSQSALHHQQHVLAHHSSAASIPRSSSPLPPRSTTPLPPRSSTPLPHPPHSTTPLSPQQHASNSEGNNSGNTSATATSSTTISSSPVLSSSDSILIIGDLRSHIATLEISLREADRLRDTLRDVQRQNEQLHKQYQNILVDTLAKKRDSERKKRSYNTLLKAMCFKTFFREKQIREKLVMVLKMLNGSLTNAEVKKWRRGEGAGRSSGKEISATADDSNRTNGTKKSKKRASAIVPITASDEALSDLLDSTSFSRPHTSSSTSHTTLLPSSSLPSSSLSSHYLNSGDSETVRSEEDFEEVIRKRKVWLEKLCNGSGSSGGSVNADGATAATTNNNTTSPQHIPPSKLSRTPLLTLLSALTDTITPALSSLLLTLTEESDYTRVLSETHLQSIITLKNDIGEGQKREGELEKLIEKLKGEVEKEKQHSAHQSAKLLEATHEAQRSSVKRHTEEQKQIVAEQKIISALVERSHTLRRKVRDSEATLEALEKKKGRMQRQEFTTGMDAVSAGGTMNGLGAVMNHGSEKHHTLAASPASTTTTVASAPTHSHSPPSSSPSTACLTSKHGLGGGGLGTLTMAMIHAHEEIVKKQREENGVSEGDEKQPFASMPSTSREISPPRRATTSHAASKASLSSPSTARLLHSAHSQARIPHQQQQQQHDTALPSVTHATLGRLTLTLPIVPLYTPSPSSNSTRPLLHTPDGANHGFSGVTGLGTSAGLRVGQRFERKLGDFEKMEVEKLVTRKKGGGNGNAFSSSSTPSSSNPTAPSTTASTSSLLRAQILGSSTGSVTATRLAAQTHSQSKYVATAYKQHHVPIANVVVTERRMVVERKEKEVEKEKEKEKEQHSNPTSVSPLTPTHTAPRNRNSKVKEAAAASTGKSHILHQVSTTKTAIDESLPPSLDRDPTLPLPLMSASEDIPTSSKHEDEVKEQQQETPAVVYLPPVQSVAL